MTEKLMARWVKEAMPMALWERMENAAGTGTADLNGCFLGVELWLELKQVTNLKLHNLRPSQVAWHTKRSLAGSKTYFLLWDSKTGWYYVHGRYASDLMAYQQAKEALPLDICKPISDLRSWLEDRFTGSRM